MCLKCSSSIGHHLNLGLPHRPDETGKKSRANPFALHGPRDVSRVPPLEVGSRVTLRTQAIEPPFAYVQLRGRSYAVTSVKTTGPCFHFGRNLVPTPTGPSVS